MNYTYNPREESSPRVRVRHTGAGEVEYEFRSGTNRFLTAVIWLVLVAMIVGAVVAVM